MKWMKWINLVTLALLIIGGLSWLATAAGGHEMDVVANAFGSDDSVGARVVYAVVGLCALWQLVPFAKAWRLPEPEAEADRHGAASAH